MTESISVHFVSIKPITFIGFWLLKLIFPLSADSVSLTLFLCISSKPFQNEILSFHTRTHTLNHKTYDFMQDSY